MTRCETCHMTWSQCECCDDTAPLITERTVIFRDLSRLMVTHIAGEPRAMVRGQAVGRPSQSYGSVTLREAGRLLADCRRELRQSYDVTADHAGDVLSITGDTW